MYKAGCTAHPHPGACLCCEVMQGGIACCAGCARCTRWGLEKPDSSMPACLPACLNSPCHCRCHALRAGEAERAAVLEVAEERCAAVAELLDDVQELQGRVEQVGIRACAATTTAVCIACW